MHRVLLFVALTTVAVSISWSAELTERQPPEWPKLPTMSETCREAEGTYEDPNTWIWERQNPATGEKFNGKRHAAWVAFALPAAAVRPEDTKAGSRTFALSIDQPQALSITYKLAGTVVATRSFQKDAWSCTPAGIVVTTIDREGAVLDKLPNEGRAIERAIVRVKDGSLYVHTVRETKTRVLGVIPQSFTHVSWQQFHLAK
jgi:hypothetical protein